MSSPKRHRRSRSHSADLAASKQKRKLDLVTTRNLTPPLYSHWHSRGRGRGRPGRRPFIRGYRGGSGYRGASQRYYSKRRSFDGRDSSRRRSRSRSRSHSQERSRSKGYHRRSRSRSSKSRSSSQHRHRKSRSHERQRSHSRDAKPVRHRSSTSPENKASAKKKSRKFSESLDERDPHKTSSGGKDKSISGQHLPPTKKNLEDHSDDEGRSKHQEGKYSNKSGSGSSVASHSKKSLAATKGKELTHRNRLHEIFSAISQDASFELDEDISIAIQRNPYAEPSEDSTVTVVFDEALFNMIYPYEGRKHKPVFDREEIKVFGHDKNLADDPDFERRVIRVKPGKSTQQADATQSSSYHYRSSLEITRTVRRGRSSSSASRSRSRTPPKLREPKFRLQVSADPNFEARYAELQRREQSGSSQRASLDPGDLRHELSSSRKSSSDSRNRMDRNRNPSSYRQKSADDRESRPAEPRKEKEELPDFSRRKDKYQYTPWLDQPELIPKDPKYFMHDDREAYNPRGRGRGGFFFRGRMNSRRPFRPFRSRGGSRGGYISSQSSSYRGRGSYSSDTRPRSPGRPLPRQYRGDGKSVEKEWKHDKFSELQTDEEKKSHREDEQHPHSTSER